MIDLSKMSLAFVRTSLFLSQRQLAEIADVAQVTIARCERGDALSLLSAQKILFGLNTTRQQKGQEPLKLEDLDWTLQQK